MVQQPCRLFCQNQINYTRQFLKTNTNIKPDSWGAKSFQSIPIKELPTYLFKWSMTKETWNFPIIFHICKYKYFTYVREFICLSLQWHFLITKTDKVGNFYQCQNHKNLISNSNLSEKYLNPNIIINYTNNLFHYYFCLYFAHLSHKRQKNKDQIW